ncbi:hypothetical protein KP509_1Z247900 [Ceratopteris richardii]|nr:hypothetical protein KP509_1Z247900 [Ceratopteris richardii]
MIHLLHKLLSLENSPFARKMRHYISCCIEVTVFATGLQSIMGKLSPPPRAAFSPPCMSYVMAHGLIDADMLLMMGANFTLCCSNSLRHEICKPWICCACV